MNDQLRDDLTNALDRVILGPAGMRILGSDSCPTSEGIDAIQPVIREHLAQAWDGGHANVCNDHNGCNCNLARDNPWREVQP